MSPLVKDRPFSKQGLKKKRTRLTLTSLPHPQRQALTTPKKPAPQKSPLSFQDLILRLHQFWADHGCLILQSYDNEMGAGTFHPATFLGALGPKPTSVAFVQACRRPADGRYGENPNRLQHYYQYQVIIKPSPDNIQDLYLESLVALGITLSEHDIRFVQDDWESPTLGAWGLGWEVRLDGMEVTQFTYFQEVGGIALDPTCVEITYGLERIAMYLQGVDNIFDLAWSHHYAWGEATGHVVFGNTTDAGTSTAPSGRCGSGVAVATVVSGNTTDVGASTVPNGRCLFGVAGATYGEIHHQDEVEYSKHNFEEADVNMLKQQFAFAEDESGRLLAKGLIRPAYDYCIKSSHLFNLLDARGVLAVAERVGYIARVRHLARRIATAYVNSETEGIA